MFLMLSVIELKGLEVNG